jgi:serine phosphatase RsbU (regulator of sigma subunit)
MVGDWVILEASLYATGVFVACLFLLSSRHLITYKRWYDFSFLYGMALLAWGLGHLFHLHPNLLLKLLAYPVSFLFYLFLLMAFHAFPLSPHLYYERWKTVLDIIILSAIYLTYTLTVWFDPSRSALYELLIHAQGSLFILGRAYTVYLGNERNSQRDHNHLLLVGAVLFLLIDATGLQLFKVPMEILTAVTFAVILLGLYNMRKLRETVDVLDEYLYFHEKLSFQFRDDHVNRAYFFLSVLLLIAIPHHSPVFLTGTGISLLVLLGRIYCTRRDNDDSMKEMFHLSRSLEKQFEENMQEIRQKNEHLSNLLSVKQSYEMLLVESNRQSMREVHFENLHQLIEEIADAWYAHMIGLDFLRISLRSPDGTSCYETVRGRPEPHREMRQKPVSLTVLVDDQADTPLVPRQIVIEALTTSIYRNDTDMEDSFFNLLAIHVRGLIQRCLQNQQAMELRLMEQEMELASKIQFSLIPKERLVLPGLQAKAVYLPVAYIGGDYVDFVAIDDRFSCFLVADISGHGIPASLLTTGLRIAFRAVLQTTRAPDEILGRLNRLMHEDLAKTRSFITMFVAVYDQQAGVMRTSRAGHPQPLYLSATKQMILPCARGIGLGLAPETRYTMDEWAVEEDFTLVMYTDGLTDLGRKEAALTAQDWLQRFQAAVSADQREGIDRIAAIEEEVWQRTRANEQEDDISLLILDIKARPEADPLVGSTGVQPVPRLAQDFDR